MPDRLGAGAQQRAAAGQPVAYTNVTLEDYVHTDYPPIERPPCPHTTWRGPTPAMMEDGDERQVCASCGARRQPPERRWQHVATIALPMSPSVLHEVTEWLATGVQERLPGTQLVVQGTDDDRVELGYYVTVQP